MSEATNLVAKAGDDEDIEPQERYSSSDVIAAADELKFKQQEKKRAVESKVESGKISKKQAASELKKAYHTLAQTYDKPTLEKEYETSMENGLTAAKAAEFLEKYGPNELTPPKHDPWWLRLLKSVFGGFFNILLWLGSILCFIAYGIDTSDIKDASNLYLGVVLGVVVTLTGIFGYYQESKSADLMGSLSKMKPKDVVVTRDGKRETLQPSQLVPGDICELTTGMALPADLRVVACTPDMEVDNSSLTGESDALKRDWKPSNETPAESPNLCFFGTLIVNGKGQGIVIATGDETFMGRTAQLASSTDNDETPIAKEIKDFVLKVSVIAFTLGVSFFIIGMVENGDLVGNVVFLIGIIVANVPEGLLATVTVSLTLTARRMFDKNVRVKNLESVETLGSTSVICSDKTGTLTTNVMTCQHVFYDMKECECDTDNPMNALKGDFYILDEEEKQTNKRNADFLKLVRCGALCNNADFVDGAVDPTANATEAAMVKFSSGHVLAEYRQDIPEYRKRHHKLHEIPFNSTNKWQVSVHELKQDMLLESEEKLEEGGKRALVQMKGAPERILVLCDRYVSDGEVVALDEEKREAILKGVMDLGGRGERVLALAELLLDTEQYDISREEPIIGQYEKEKDESCAPNEVVVVFEEARHKIAIEAVDENGEAVAFADCFVVHLMEAIQGAMDGQPKAAQRLGFADHGQPLDAALSFKELGIESGSVIQLMRGPYVFSGTNKKELNWPLNRSDEEEGLVFVGLYAMIDPPRPGVPEAVTKCQSAGIKVVMVTGDHPVTAKAIARKVNIIEDNNRTKQQAADDDYNGDLSRVQDTDWDAIVVSGTELQAHLDGEDPQKVEDFWNEALNKKNCVFARTSPQQKLLIVTAVQARGGIVAVTGDGVNDSPALKKADIGVAMGITGTEVAKEAADMILLDDNFASIVNGVEEGRIIFDNLKKSIAYTLSSNIPEIAPFLLFQTAAIPLPLSTVMILLVDLGTDLAPAIAMAYEGRESDIMSRPPRNPDIHKLVTMRLISFAYLQIGMLQAIAGFYAYFTVLHGFGFKPGHLVGLDIHRVFNEQRKEVNLRDAYYLWCFDTAITEECIYLPNLYYGDSDVTVRDSNGNDVNVPWYTEDEFSAWLANNEDFAKEAKEYLVKISKQEDGIADLTLSMLEDGDDALTWDGADGFEQLYWQSDETATYYSAESSLFTKLSQDTQHSVNSNDLILFPNRRCFEEDYSELWRETADVVTDAVQTGKLANAPPPFCNVDGFDNKPRTSKYGEGATGDNLRSLFPMQTRTRVESLAMSNSAYFISIIVVQWADLMICKTRVRSLFEQGMTNTFMNYSLFFETILGAFLVYVPIANTVTGTRPLRFTWWTAGVPFSLMIYIYDEVRKGWIRKNRNGWIHRNTYW